MKANPKNVLSGVHNLTGGQACVEGALAAGCGFLGYYPMIPALDFVNHFIKRSKETGSKFIQMEDEISALAAVIGVSWTGLKAISITSSSGFSNMMEHLGLGVMLETPSVIVNVQVVGPGDGDSGLPSQGDTMQARWGSHGDYEIIALAPGSVQDMFDYTIKAFSLSERFRTPVVILTDNVIAKRKGKVSIPEASEINIYDRKLYKGPKDKYMPFLPDDELVPPMVNIGDGYRFHVTGLTHNHRGYPIMNEECQELNVHRLVNKIRENTDKITEWVEDGVDSADIVVVTYGLLSNAVKKAVEKARAEGIKTGSLRLVTVWPFPEKRVDNLASRLKGIVVPEINLGQMVFEVERASHGQTNTFFVQCSGEEADDVEMIFGSIKEALTKKKKYDDIIEYTPKSHGA